MPNPTITINQPSTLITVCEFCRAIHVVNTIFCDECGHFLLEDNTEETDPLEITEIGWVGGTLVNGHRENFPLTQETSPLAIRLKIGLDKREIEVLLNKTITLGRTDPNSNIFPEIDLTYEGETAQSVSRRHAAITKQKGMIFIEDLASINGTFVNGKRLIPFVPDIIYDGDMIQLGKLLIEVKIRGQ
ncbi:MAG: FHA domain-containing protein [Anaerolineae bacterium]